jgi:hypothetical protein
MRGSTLRPTLLVALLLVAVPAGAFLAGRATRPPPPVRELNIGVVAAPPHQTTHVLAKHRFTSSCGPGKKPGTADCLGSGVLFTQP